jgi:uncharacterized protein YceK
MKFIYKTIFILILATVLAGCAASVAYLNDGIPKYPATNADSVKIYSERKIDKETIEIGYVSVHMTDDPNGDLMKEILKKRAAEIGADAIVNFQIMGPLAEGIAVKFK